MYQTTKFAFLEMLSGAELCKAANCQASSMEIAIAILPMKYQTRLKWSLVIAIISKSNAKIVMNLTHHDSYKYLKNV